MIRFRGKAIGLGLALAAGPFAAAQPPALLPPTIRGGGDWSAGAPADPVWFPARGAPRPAAPVVMPSVAPPTAPTVPTVVPPATVRPVRAEVEPTSVGPRSFPLVSDLGPLPTIPPLPDAIGLGPLPVIPPLPEVAAPAPQPFPVLAEAPAPPLPMVMPARPVLQPQPAPPPRSVEPPVRPAPPTPTPTPLPQPNPVPAVPPSDAPPRPMPAAQPELQTAPPHLLVPEGYTVRGKHATFGSTPVNISRDYPTIRELFHNNHPDGIGGDDDPGAGPVSDRGYVRLEYLMWWVNPQRIPVLASTSVNGGLGFLGDPGTVSLLGPGRYGTSFRDGVRVRGGWWCDEDGHLGLDGGFFFLGRTTSTTTFDSNNTPTITRPFFAPNGGGFEFGERVARPGFSVGTLEVAASSYLYGFDANIRHALCRTCGFRDEVFVGYRYLSLSESLTITENITALPGNNSDPAGTRIVVQDKFSTRNTFNGGQLGYAAERNWGRFSLDGRASVALGSTHQTVSISGYQVRQRPGEAQPTLFPNGGLLAAGPNLGRFSDDRFSVVPEVSFNLGYWLTPSTKFFVGYNALYWSNVARPGDQIDRTVDVTFIPNPPMDMGQTPAFSGQNRPAVPFKQDHLWVNGIQFGAEWRW